jgi:hypothetical protein
MTRGGGVPDDWGVQNVKERSGMTDVNASFCEEENVVLRPIKRCFPFHATKIQHAASSLSANVR